MTVSEKIVELVVAFHGHLCPGLAIGIRAAELALQEMQEKAGDEELVAVVETDDCSVDAIQFMTGCTFGKGNFIFEDVGKSAYRFYRRSDGKAIRLFVKKNAAKRENPQYQILQDKKQKEGLTEAEENQMLEFREQRIIDILSADLADLFTITPVENKIPERAHIYESVDCDVCHERTMETRVRRIHGQWVCLSCYKKIERKLS
jgi:formylmethanofuran dehydrogenase subunit E